MTILNGKTPECPRCGYDLRGMAESWSNACPVEGCCAECGLVFAWRDIFTEDALTPSWCVEFSTPGQVPRALLATLGLSFVPWRFWSAVKMTHTLRPRRLAFYVVLLTPSCLGLLAIGNGLSVYGNWKSYFGPGAQYTNTMSIGEATVRAMVLPFSGEPLGTVTWKAMTRPYPCPRDLLENWWSAWCLLLYGAIVAILGPIVLTGLIASRRRAGIRPRHLVRVFVYSLGWIPFMWASGLVALLPYQSTWFAGRLSMLRSDIGDYIMMFVIPSFVLLWWQAAVRRYLHMEHSWAVAAAVAVLAMGGGMVIMSSVEWGFVEHIFTRWGLV